MEFPRVTFVFFVNFSRNMSGPQPTPPTGLQLPIGQQLGQTSPQTPNKSQYVKQELRALCSTRSSQQPSPTMPIGPGPPQMVPNSPAMGGPAGLLSPQPQVRWFINLYRIHTYVQFLTSAVSPLYA